MYILRSGIISTLEYEKARMDMVILEQKFKNVKKQKGQ